MGLGNLVGISLEAIEPDVNVIKRLRAAALRNINDSRLENLSTENRFDLAYKAIMQMANTALQANGYRTLTSRPGHHATVIQTPNQTIGLDRETVVVIDALRKQRNVADYSGDLIPNSTAEECQKIAEILFERLTSWLTEHKPESVS